MEDAMKRLVIALAALVLLVTLPAFAQSEAGDTELQVQGSLSLGLDDEFDDSGSVSVNYGRFFRARQEAGVTVFGTFNSDGDIAGFGGPFYRYNFSDGKTVPYVGAALGLAFGDYAVGDSLLNFEGGVRWFLERNIAFTLAGSTNYDVEESEFADRLQILFGFSYVWNR
jgi:hypothetical protein